MESFPLVILPHKLVNITGNNELRPRNFLWENSSKIVLIDFFLPVDVHVFHKKIEALRRPFFQALLQLLIWGIYYLDLFDAFGEAKYDSYLSKIPNSVGSHSVS
jgi:hypothetical protein